MCHSHGLVADSDLHSDAVHKTDKLPGPVDNGEREGQFFHH